MLSSTLPDPSEPVREGIPVQPEADASPIGDLRPWFGRKPSVTIDRDPIKPLETDHECQPD
jgi:hypothetical protein